MISINLRTPFAATLAAMALSACGEKIDARQLEDNNGLYYKRGDSGPFTGHAMGYAPSYDFDHDLFAAHDGTACDLDLKKGVLDGDVVCKLPSGAKVAAFRYTGGKRNGAEQRWGSGGTLVADRKWDNGALLTEQTFDPATGKLSLDASWTRWESGRGIEGVERKWDSAGKLVEDGPYKNGEPHGCVANRDDKGYYLGCDAVPHLADSAGGDSPAARAVAAEFADGKLSAAQAIRKLSQLPQYAALSVEQTHNTGLAPDLQKCIDAEVQNTGRNVVYQGEFEYWKTKCAKDHDGAVAQAAADARAHSPEAIKACVDNLIVETRKSNGADFANSADVMAHYEEQCGGKLVP